MKNLFFLSIIATILSLTSCGDGQRVSVDAVIKVIPSVDTLGVVSVSAEVSNDGQTYLVNIADPKVANTLLIAQSFDLLRYVKAEAWFDNQTLTNVEAARIDMYGLHDDIHQRVIRDGGLKTLSPCPVGFHLENGFCVQNQ